jgi:hypothetical protein
MLDLGFIRPGQTIRIPFSSFDKDDSSSITMTNYTVSDILIYKDGSTTERASTSGFTATTDFDAKTGKHIAVIDLADNTTAGFFSAGSEYLVAIDAVTIDGVTTGGWIARFRIGYVHAILNTTISSINSQTSVVLTSGPAEDDALNGLWCIVHDVASAVQFAVAVIIDYVGSTKTATLASAPTFAVAATDNVSVMGPINDKTGYQLHASQPDYAPAKAGDEMALTSAQLSAIVAAIEAEIADDATGEAVKQAIIDKLLENGNAARDAVLNRVLSGNHDVAGSLGKLLQSITEARLAELDPANLPATADAAAADAAAAKTAAQAAKAVTDKIDSGLEADGPVYRFTENMLEQAPAGGGVGGGDTYAIQPYSSSAPQRSAGTRLTLFEDEFGFWVAVTSYNADRTPLDLTGKTLRLIIEDHAGTVLATLNEASGVLEKISAADGTWRFKATADMCAAVAEHAEAHWWDLSDVTGGAIDETLAWGRLWVQRRAGH